MVTGMNDILNEIAQDWFNDFESNNAWSYFIQKTIMKWENNSK